MGTTQERATHILHITKVADDDSDDIEWTITCNDVRLAECQIWGTCAVGECTIASPYEREDDDPEDGMDEVVRHGIVHKWIEGDWMTASGHCATIDADFSDAIWEIAEARGVGDWPVEVTYEGDGGWWLNDLTPSATPHLTAPTEAGEPR